MENYETINCIICNSNNLEKITDKGQFGFPTYVCICKECGLSFLNPRWDNETYLNFYKTEYDKFYRSSKSSIPLIQNPSSYYPIIQRIKNLNKENTSFDKILDIGSGDGSLLMAFIENKIGNEYYSIEASVEYKLKIEQKGIKFISNDIDSEWDKSFNGHFDFIIMRHVLEHFSRPDLVLNKLKNVLSPNGLLYIAVPDSLKPIPPFTDSFIRVVHTFYFNKPTLTNLLCKSGYEIIDIQEGDKCHDELFVFAKQSTNSSDITISKINYEIQYKIFLRELENEQKIIYKIKKVLKKGFNLIVKIKKSFFPKPIKKRKNIC